MMRVVIVPAALGQWMGSLYIEDEVRYTVRGARPGCVARDILNWMQYYLADPTQQVILGIEEYE